MTEPRVLIDARGTQDGFKQHRQRGIGHYARNLIEHLRESSPGLRLTYLVDRSKPVESSFGSAGTELLEHETNHLLDRLSTYFEPQFSLPATLGKIKYDLIHYLAHEDAALYSPCRFIVTVHDTLRFEKHEQSAATPPVQRVKNMVIRGFSKRIIRRAAHIITDSEHSKHDIIEHLDVPPEKIRVVYLGVERKFLVRRSEPEIDKMRSKYKLPKEYLLYVGGIDPRKNIPNLFKALSILHSGGMEQPALAFAGKISNQKEYPEIMTLCSAMKLEDKVIFLGYVPDDDLPLLYSASRAFVFPSFYEGFGLPVLQSMASGTPVVTTRLSSIPEIGGDTVHYADPHDPSEIARGIRVILNDADYAFKLSRAGMERAREFSWEKTARETLAVYAEVIERGDDGDSLKSQRP